MKKLSININGRELSAYAGQTILEAARDNGIFIPTLCEDHRTEIYGACGICVVEAEGNPKLLKACATEIADGMIIQTDTPRVITSRKTMLELLLSDHAGDCRPPCVRACPAHTDCQGYVGLVANGEYKEAYDLIMKRIPLPASIGRVCPHPCETDCRRGLVDDPIGIAQTKRFCGDFALDDMAAGNLEEWLPEIAPETHKRVAVVGGGPYGLSISYFLRLLGHDVTIFEAMPKAGGMLRYGIPEYRLPKDVLDAEIEKLVLMGVRLETGVRIGRDISFDKIYSDYDAVCVGVGAWISTGTGAKGEDLPGVIGGIELLTKVAGGEEVFLGKRVAIVGGGNTAMDACRTAVRMGAQEVYNIYRRTKDEMPADFIEIEEAEEEGVIFKTLTNPIEITPGADGRVSKIKLQIMQLGEPDASGRRAPVPVKGKTETLAVDTVILAVGQAPDPASLGAKGLELTRKNGIIYDKATFATSLPGVFAGGDCGNDKVSIAVEAIADAVHSAGVINAYLNGEEGSYKSEYAVVRDDITERTFEDRERMCRPAAPVLSPDERKHNFVEVAAGWTPEDAEEDGDRCLECGCGDYFECKLIDYARQYNVAPERFKGEYSAALDDGSLPAPDADKDGHPFIEREDSKCILCGLCVRVCEEVVGAKAIDFSARGFDTSVKSAFGLPLKESSCVSCGLCVDACPTGALRERLSIWKSVPLETTVTKTACPHCSVGCELELETYGDLLIKTNSVDPCSHDQAAGRKNRTKALLCGRGKFGFDCSEVPDANSGEDADKKPGETVESLLMPYTKEGSAAPVSISWYDAFITVVKKAQSILAKYGPGSVAVSVSDRLTNEEALASRNLAGQLGARVFSFNNRRSAATELFGAPAAADFEELLHTDYILAAGVDFAANPVLALKLGQAASAGVRIVRLDVGSNSSACREAAFGAHIGSEAVQSPNSLKLLQEIMIALEGGKASAKAAKIATELKEAKKAMIVYQRNTVTTEAADILCRIALMSGHACMPRNNVFEILPKNNSRGLYDLEIQATPKDILESELGAGVKGLIIVGEDPEGQIAAASSGGVLSDELKAAKALIKQAEFIAVLDTHPTKTAQKSDVVIPMTGFASSEGTYTNTEGRSLKIHAAVTSPILTTNTEILSELTRIAGGEKAGEDACACSCMHESDSDHAAVCSFAPVRPDAGIAYARLALLPSAENGKFISPLPTSDHLTRMANRRLGTDVYGD